VAEIQGGKALKIQPQLASPLHVAKLVRLVEDLIAAVAVDGVVEQGHRLFRFPLDALLGEAQHRPTVAFEFVVAVLVVVDTLRGVVPGVAVALQVNRAGLTEDGEVQEEGVPVDGLHPFPLGGDAGIVEQGEHPLFQRAAVEQKVNVRVAAEKTALGGGQESDPVPPAAGDGLGQFFQFFQLDFVIALVRLWAVGLFVGEEVTAAHFGHALDGAVVPDFPFVLL